MSDTQETDVSACIHHAEETPYDDWVYAGHAKLIAERDTMKAERNQFMNALNRVKKELAAANKGAETNAKVNQILCKKLFLLIRRLKRREKEYLNASLGELCEDLFSRNRYEGESIGTRWAREDLELILSKLKIKEEA